MFRLKYAVQNYAWGHIGNDSEVYNLLCDDGQTEKNDSSKNYAELWLGTHVSGPSIITSKNSSLLNYIKENPNVVGNKTHQMFGKNLPFLLKVLSINTALSIQIHPNKKEAEILHKQAPLIYKDDNHKPELAIALTDFEALVGFRPLKEISIFIQSIPQLSNLIGNVRKDYMKLIDDEQRKAALKVCYKKLMTSPDDVVKSEVESLVNDFENGKAVEYLTEDHKELADLFIRLSKQYPGDIGLFSVFLFNWVKLRPSESIFLEANLPHAYISGTIIECMACSDNVVRAGLTPKLKDVNTLLSMINYNSYTSDQIKFSSIEIESKNDFIKHSLYKPACPDFMVLKTEIQQCLTFQPMNLDFQSGSIILVLNGSGKLRCTVSKKMVSELKYARGFAFFLSAESSIDVQASENSVFYRAYVNE